MLAILEQLVAGADDATPVDGRLGQDLLRIGRGLPEKERFSKAMYRDRPWTEWTLGMVRAGMAELAEKISIPAANLVTEILLAMREVLADRQHRFQSEKERIPLLREDAEGARRQEQQRRRVPEAPLLNAVTRYEGQLRRQFCANVQLLNAMKSERAASSVPSRPSWLDHGRGHASAINIGSADDMALQSQLGDSMNWDGGSLPSKAN